MTRIEKMILKQQRQALQHLKENVRSSLSDRARASFDENLQLVFATFGADEDDVDQRHILELTYLQGYITAMADSQTKGEETEDGLCAHCQQPQGSKACQMLHP